MPTSIVRDYFEFVGEVVNERDPPESAVRPPVNQHYWRPVTSAITLEVGPVRADDVRIPAGWRIH
jgi:hypothetical protein